MAGWILSRLLSATPLRRERLSRAGASVLVSAAYLNLKYATLLVLPSLKLTYIARHLPL
jgi:hypothetical protein